MMVMGAVCASVWAQTQSGDAYVSQWLPSDTYDGSVKELRGVGFADTLAQQYGETPFVDQVQERERPNYVRMWGNRMWRDALREAYDGSRGDEVGIMAAGHWKQGKAGTLQGYGAYRRGKVYASRFNFMNYASLFSPYLVGDSTVIQQVSRETYTLYGAYSKVWAKWALGVDAFYEGIASKHTDNPKFSNYSHLFRPAVSVGRSMRRGDLGVRIYPEVHLQSLSVSTEHVSDVFFLYCGFGQWNKRESLPAQSYSRQQSFMGVGGELWGNYHVGRWKWRARVGGVYRYLNTEEVSHINFYEAHVQRYAQSVSGQYVYGAHRLLLSLSGSAERWKGRDNIYESVKQEGGDYLYDYEKVGYNDFYSRERMNGQASVAYAYAITPSHHLSVDVYGAYVDAQEKYKLPKKEVAYSNALVGGRVGYDWQSTRWSGNVSVGASQRMNLSKKYEVPLESEDEVAETLMVGEMVEKPYEMHIKEVGTVSAHGSLWYEMDDRKKAVGIVIDGAANALRKDVTLSVAYRF